MDVDKETPKETATKKGDDAREENNDKNDAKMDVDDDKEEEKITDPKPTSEIEEKVSIILAETKSQSYSNFAETIEKLLYLEKKQRQSEHEANTLFIAKSMLSLCKDSGDWNITIEQIAILSRRRSQFRRVVIRIVQLSMTWIDELSDLKETRLRLINTLINVTEGKIFVEVERARLTRRLAGIKEEEGDSNAACDILQELQIETFGSMKKKEKCDFLLEQFRLNLKKKDFVRANIVRNKITQRIISGFADLEKKYWELSLILFYHYEQNFLELAKSYFRLKELVDNNDHKLSALRHMIFATVLSEYSNEQNDLLHRILKTEKKLLEQLAIYRQLLALLTTNELIEWPLPKEMMDTFISFQFDGVFDDTNPDFSAQFQDRIIEHNIRVVSKYYTRISMKRLSTFLAIDLEKSEKYLSKMVTDGHIFARINRLDGIIRFKKKQTPNMMLNDWKTDTDQLLDLVDLTCHQIHKEMVIHKSAKKGKKVKGKR